MRTTVTKYACLVLLLAAALFWRDTNPLRVVFNSAICVGAIVVLQQALSARKKYWVAAFALVAFAFNPIAPLDAGNATSFLVLVCLAFVTFAVSLIALRPQVLLSMPSITGRNPRSESL